MHGIELHSHCPKSRRVPVSRFAGPNFAGISKQCAAKMPANGEGKLELHGKNGGHEKERAKSSLESEEKAK